MNERIRDLEVQCWEPQGVGAAQFDSEKFAELIVKECGIVGDNWVDNEDDGKNRISDKFKEHFGVKE